MNTYQEAITKLNQLTEPSLQEVNRYIDALLFKQNLASSLPESMGISVDEALGTLQFMRLAETGFAEWNDPEEDIYNDAA